MKRPITALLIFLLSVTSHVIVLSCYFIPSENKTTQEVERLASSLSIVQLEYKAKKPKTKTNHIDPRPIEKIAHLGEIQASKELESKLVNEFIRELRKLIEQKKYYPLMAQKLGQIGDVQISFTITRPGRIEKVKLVHSSNFPILDAAAMEIINSIKNFKPIPESIKASELRLVQKVAFQK